MRTPAAALAWELWRRHRKGMIIVVGLVLAFAFVYPRLCALADFHLAGPDALNEIDRKLSPGNGPLLLVVIQTLYILFLTVGPGAAMRLPVAP